MTTIILRQEPAPRRHTRKTLERMAVSMERDFGAAAAAHELGIWLGPCRGECELSREDEGVLARLKIDLSGMAR